MIRHLMLATLLLTSAAPSVFGKPWAVDMFETTNHDFGVVARGAPASFEFKLTNKYVEDVHIASVRSSCGCTTPRIMTADLKSLETGSILATYNTSSFLGKRSATIVVTIDKPYFAEVKLTVSGFIRGDIVFDPGTADFGTISQGAAASKLVKLNYAGHSNWRIVDVRSSAKSNYIVDLKEAGRIGNRVTYHLNISLKDSASTGFFQDQITIVTNDTANQTIPLTVHGKIVPSLVVSPASLFMGVLKLGQSVTKTVAVRGKKPFRIVEMKCGHPSFAFKSTDEAKTLHMVPITFRADKSGNVSQTIEIHTDLGGSVKCLATATVQDGS